MSSAKVRVVRHAAASLILPLALAGAAYGRQTVGRAQAPDGTIVFTGRYSNYRFGFGFLIPRGLRGTGPPDHHPQDGVVIDLTGGAAGAAEIRVYGHYDATFAGSARAQAGVELRYALEDSPALILLRRRDGRLGGFRAVRFAYEFKGRPAGETLVRDHVVAFRHEGDEPGTFFHARLTTTRRRYAEDRKTFEQVLRTWRAVPVL